MSKDARLFASIRVLISFVFFSIVFTNISLASSTDYKQRPSAEGAASLDKDARLNIKVGQSLFERLWVTAPASTVNADGLGPLYNARSCAACHPGNGRSRPSLTVNGGIGFLMRIDISAQNEAHRKQLLDKRINNVPDPMYGIQLQNFAIPGHVAEYQLSMISTDISLMFDDGDKITLSRPVFEINDLAYGPLHSQVRLSPRLAPQIAGLGLLEAIDEQDIINQADPEDSDDDGISGRANWVWDHEKSKINLGRFGFKAGLPTINQQVQHAFLNDIGLSVPLFKDASGDCTVLQVKCQQAPNGNSPQYDDVEASQQIIDLVNLYITHLSLSPVQQVENSVAKAGEIVFNEIGCQSCHTPRYITGNSTPAKENHHREIYPYTDMLLHDMGEGLADNRPEGDATGREWRTTPLWGIGSAMNNDAGRNYLHDGRAGSILEAILWHGGEAESQRDAVLALDRDARKQLITFLEGL
ncbi:MAG: di-heme oxidoredictase family protein [Gammaproteobacteria bacterium]